MFDNTPNCVNSQRYGYFVCCSTFNCWMERIFHSFLCFYYIASSKSVHRNERFGATAHPKHIWHGNSWQWSARSIATWSHKAFIQLTASIPRIRFESAFLLNMIDVKYLRAWLAILVLQSFGSVHTLLSSTNTSMCFCKGHLNVCLALFLRPVDDFGKRTIVILIVLTSVIRYSYVFW